MFSQFLIKRYRFFRFSNFPSYKLSSHVIKNPKKWFFLFKHSTSFPGNLAYNASHFSKHYFKSEQELVFFLGISKKRFLASCFSKRLDFVLFFVGLCKSVGESRSFIKKGSVFVNGIPANSQSLILTEGDLISFDLGLLSLFRRNCFSNSFYLDAGSFLLKKQLSYNFEISFSTLSLCYCFNFKFLMVLILIINETLFCF